MAIQILYNLFPELNESEDEKWRKWLINHLKGYINQTNERYGDVCKDAISWLEKQREKEEDVRYKILEELLYADDIYQMSMNDAMVGEAKSKAIASISKLSVSELLELEKQGEQKPTNIEPKFKVGDWIIGNTNNIYTVICVIDDEYRLLYNIDDSIVCAKIKTIDKKFHLWTIQDAKDGDVLTNGKIILIFKQFEELAYRDYREHIIAYVGLDTSSNIQVTDGCWQLGIDKASPATKEQRDILFQKIKEAGYEWDTEKKELMKIKQKPEVESTEHSYITTNSEFFQWIYDRLKYVYNENPNVDYMLSLKERIEDMHKSAEWSEEDEEILKTVILYVKKYQQIVNPANETGESDLTDWLKSLKSQPRWKPSDLQFEALESAYKQLPNIQHFLQSLYNDLKKL